MRQLLMTDSLGDTAGMLSVPTDDRRARRTGLAILLVTFAGFGGWAAVGKLDSAAVAPGLVTVESYRKTIQHLEGGIVEDILVRDGDSLQQSGYTDKLRLLELERNIAQLEGERAGHLAEIAKTRMQIGETKLQILQLRKQLQTEVVADLRDTQTKLFDLIERMRALQDTVERTEIRAPTGGTVVGLGVHTVGGVVGPGTPLLEIVPKGEQLVVEAKVQPTDIDKVHPGLAADIRFTAFKLRITPVVEGQVLTVSADRLIDPDTKYPYYLARIQVTAQELERLQGLELLPGMPAEVMIKTGERTVLNYLLRPLLDAFARAFRED